MLIYYEMIITIALANTPIMPRNYQLFFVVRTFEIHSLNTFKCMIQFY